MKLTRVRSIEQRVKQALVLLILILAGIIVSLSVDAKSNDAKAGSCYTTIQKQN